MSNSGELESSLVPTYHVHLLLEHPVKLEPNAILKQLQVHCGVTERLPMKADNRFWVFWHHDYKVRFQEGDAPAQSMIRFVDQPSKLDSLNGALQQTWDWNSAEAAVRRHQAVVYINDFLASGLAYQQRLRLMHNLIQALLELVPCSAIYWTHAERIVDPTTYKNSKLPDQFDPVFPAVNVRLFRIQNRKPGEVVMDTLGLGALGIPDLQCHFVNLDVTDMARVLYNTAYYLFEKGDVINDGETVQGIRNDSRWRCQHEVALVPPEREVLDMNPGRPYVAGERD